MSDTVLDPTERRMVNKAITTSAEASIANGLLQGTVPQIFPLENPEKCGEIPAKAEKVVNPIVWTSDIPGRSKPAEPVSIALKPGPTLTIEEVYSSQPDLKDMPLENPGWELFTDGSSFMKNGNRVTGYAVTMQDKVIEAKALPADVSSQKAKLIALKRALDLSEGKKTKDNKYNFQAQKYKQRWTEERNEKDDNWTIKPQYANEPKLVKV
ncbi:hypothetical protein HGM15179_018578 [Zosterops borbonicus]|uniref:RNase H type-1 domain-containing protein n=1 Tax=Zosterops borbonicus TaxID=364589 RepID=A0A8K1DBR6_9PASS|nr:hypothetical protein HGM15179_018578 [Zosterops borbonicus]